LRSPLDVRPPALALVCGLEEPFPGPYRRLTSHVAHSAPSHRLHGFRSRAVTPRNLIDRVVHSPRAPERGFATLVWRISTRSLGTPVTVSRHQTNLSDRSGWIPEHGCDPVFGSRAPHSPFSRFNPAFASTTDWVREWLDRLRPTAFCNAFESTIRDTCDRRLPQTLSTTCTHVSLGYRARRTSRFLARSRIRCMARFHDAPHASATRPASPRRRYLPRVRRFLIPRTISKFAFFVRP